MFSELEYNSFKEETLVVRMRELERERERERERDRRRCSNVDRELLNSDREY